MGELTGRFAEALAQSGGGCVDRHDRSRRGGGRALVGDRLMSVLSSLRPLFGDTSPHVDFLALQPIVERHARVVFRDCSANERADRVAEAVAAAFQSYVGLKARGRNPAKFPSRLATYAALHVKSDRHVGGHSSSRDVLSRRAQQRHGFAVQTLPVENVTWTNAFLDDQTPIPDRVAFRIDLPAFLRTLVARDQQMVLALAEGHSAKNVAQRFGLTPGRVTHLRQQWHREWLAFHQERPRQCSAHATPVWSGLNHLPFSVCASDRVGNVLG